MAEDRKEGLPDIESIGLPEADLADIATESLAQSVAAFRSLMKRYEETISASSLDTRRLYFILGEVLSAWQVIDGKFKKESREGKAPSMPFLEFVDLRQFVDRVQRKAVQKVARRYPYSAGPFTDQLREWAAGLPDSEEKRQYHDQAFAANMAYDTMMISTPTIPIVIRDFINRSEVATEAFESLILHHGSSGPPGMPPIMPTGGESGGSDGSMGRRVSNLESTVEGISKDMQTIAVGVATITETIKHLATREDVAKISLSGGGAVHSGISTKEDLTPLVSDIAWIKERLRHVPTKFGLLLAVCVPVASGLWWIFQQIFSR